MKNEKVRQRESVKVRISHLLTLSPAHFLLFLIPYTLYLIPFTSSAQSTFRAGLAAGLVSSDVVGIDPYDTDYSKLGFTAGGFSNLKLSERNSLQFEILYVQKGSLQPLDTANNNYYFYKLKLNYAEVPLLFIHRFKIAMMKKEAFPLGFEIGPSFGIRTSIRQDGIAYQNGYYLTGVYDYTQFRKTEVAANIGISYYFTKNFLFNVRYSNSIIPVIRHAIPLNTFFWYAFNKGDNTLVSFTFRLLFGGKEK
ncbi:MAG: PorT family protein [Bacteroidetes bacterium]|nr:PorT family protein [Bacteroidota bacterium]